MKIVPTTIRNLWSEEEIRILVLLSLFLQIILISFSLFRKRISNKALSFLLWLSYLSADNVAMLALGNLLSEQNDAVEANASGDIKAFWAPFLLLHLGGPDTITSYSLEDNELWLRHLLNLVVEVVVAVVVFLESLPSPHVWKPAIVVFAAGILKYGERVASLRSASLGHLRESMLSEADPGPNYAKFMQEYHSLEEAGLKVGIQIEKVPPPVLVQKKKIESQAELISIGYKFFQISKRYTVDLMLSNQERIESQTFFIQRNWKEAFQIVEVELSFLHDIFHTKAVHVHSLRGRRIASLAMAILALLLFYYRSGKRSGVFEGADVLITYLLLLVAVGLEIVAISLLIFSDWTIVALQMSDRGRLEKKLWTPKWGDAIINLRQRFLSLFPKWLLGDAKRRWSNKIRQYNLLEVCLSDYKRPNLAWALELVKLKRTRDQFWYVRSNQVDDVVKKHIFNELKAKAESTDGSAAKCKCLRPCRGEWALGEKGIHRQLSWIFEMKFDESILIWHIATYLCYRMKSQNTSPSAGKKTIIPQKSSLSGRICKKIKTILRRISHSGQDYESGDVKNVEKIKEDQHIKICREISEYLMYLVVYQPKLLPADVSPIRFLDATRLEVKKFLTNKKTDIMGELQKREQEGDAQKSSTSKATSEDMKNSIFRKILLPEKIRRFFCFCIEVVKEMQPTDKVASTLDQIGCEKLMEVGTGINPAVVKGDRSKSVLFYAVKLASEITKIFEKEKEEKKWEVMSSVWVEMLCYAAGNCSSYTHTRQLSHGGQLLTHVWLLMKHMGIGEYYWTEDAHARVKLFVET